MENALVIMSRVPKAGETKTRLMSHFSGEECVAFHEACLKDLVYIQELMQVPTYIFYSGVITESFVHLFPKDVQFLPQVGTDLGERMEKAFQQTLQTHKHVILIGSDVPNLMLADMEKAFTLLNEGDNLVFGPAIDGGYYLIGMNDLHPELFDKMTWGGAQVLAQTLARVEQKGLSCSLLRGMQDIDTFEDLEAFMNDVKNYSTHAWQVTRRILERLK